MELTNYNIAADLPEPFNIAVIADLHDGNWGNIYESMDSIKPDMIAIPGDLISSVMTDNCLSFLTSCASIAPTFYSMGNHESRLEAGDLAEIRKTGTVFLDNAAVQMGAVTIGGLTSGFSLRKEGIISKTAGRYLPTSQPNLDWLNRFAELPGFKLLLCHHAEYYPRYIRQTDINLTLAGHAHGGQIRFGNQGLFAPNQGFLPKWTAGIHEERLVISRGLANTAKWIPRLGNSPELVYVTIG